MAFEHYAYIGVYVCLALTRCLPARTTKTRAPFRGSLRSANPTLRAGASRGLHEKGERTFSFRALRRQVFVSRGLPRAEGRKFAEACGEGRPTVVTTELLNEAPRRPSGQRAAASFHAAERRSASRRGSWFAPVGANCARSLNGSTFLPKGGNIPEQLQSVC